MAAFVAGQGRSAWGDVVPSEMHDKLAWTTRIPVGVVGMITPWNFPMAIPSWKIFPALLAGNGVVMKPSELAPACGVAFVDSVHRGRDPRRALQVVHGGPEPAAALAVHPGVGAVSFTGSVPTGRKVAAAAMEVGPKLVSLELGGKNAMVVLDDADLELVVDGALFGAFGTSGQRCTSTSRLLLQKGIAGPVVERLAERAALARPRRPAAPRHRRRPGHHRRVGAPHRRHGRGGRRRGRHGHHRRRAARRRGRLRGRHLRRADDPHGRQAVAHGRPARRCSARSCR